MKSLSSVVLRTRSLQKVAIRPVSMGRNEFADKYSIAEKDPQNASKYLKCILEGNRKWVEQKKEEDPDYFKKLGGPQAPKFLFFGCSDSRVPAVQILGKG